MWGWTLWANADGGLSRTHFDWGLAAFFVALLLSTFNSIDPSRSIRFLWGWSAALVSFYFFVVILRTHLKHRQVEAVDVLLLVTAIFLLLGWVDFGLKVPRYWQFYNTIGKLPDWVRLQGFTFSSNSLGFLAAIFLVLSFGRFVFGSSNRVPWIGAIIFTLPIVIGSGSSGAVLSAGMGISVMLLLFFWPRLSSRFAHLNTGQLVGFAAVAILLGALLAGAGWRFISQDAGFADRLFIWGVGTEMLQQYPLFGAGLNTFSTFYTEASLKNHLFWHAHNYWINILAEIGLIGGIIALGMSAQLIWLIIKNFDLIQRSRVGKISLGGLASIFGHTLVESLIFSTMGLAALFLALLLVNCFSDEQEKRGPSWLGAMWPALGIILIVVGFRNAGFRNTFDEGVGFALAEDWSAAAETFDELVLRFPIHESSYLHAAALSHGMLAEQSQDHRAKAIERYESLIELEPSWAANYANLAWLYQLDGETQMALDAYVMSADLQPNQALFALNGMLLQEQTGQLADSDWLTADGLFFVGRSWHAAPYWSEFAEWPQIQSQVESRGCFNAPERAPCSIYRPTDLTTAWELLANGQQTDAAEQFNTFIHNGLAENDSSSVLGQALALELPIDDEVIQLLYTSGGNLTVDPFMSELWVNVADLKIEELETDLDLILNQTAQGFGRLGYDSYSKFVLSRPALPYDLLPGLQCFTVDDEWAWQLTQLATWYETNGRTDSAEVIWDAMAGPDGRGIGPCTREITLTE